MTLSVKHITKISLFLFLFISCSYAQETVNEVNNDTTAIFQMQKSPWGAVLRSAVLPGWGQLYNESYIKAPVVWGVLGWFTYNWFYNNNKYNDYKNLYLNNTDPRYTASYKTLRNFYRDQRDLFTIYFSLAYLLNLVDAYVDAHLFDFTVEENYLTNTKMLGIKINF